MTAALVILAVALAASIAANAAQAVWLRTARADADAMTEVAHTYQSERDAAVVEVGELTATVVDLKRRVAETASQRDEATVKKIQAKAEEIRNAETNDDAAAAFGSVFADAILPQAGGSSSGDGSR